MTSYYKLGGFEQQKLIFSQSQKQKLKSRCGWDLLSLKALGEDGSSPLPAASASGAPWLMAITLVFISVGTWPLLCVSMSLFCLTRVIVAGFRAHLANPG